MRQVRSTKFRRSSAATLGVARAIMGACLPAEQGQLFVGEP